jgi:hypothetical protein
MSLWISTTYYLWVNNILEHLNAECLTPSFKPDPADGEFFLDPLPFIHGDAMHLSLQLVSDALYINQAPGCGYSVSIG